MTTTISSQVFWDMMETPLGPLVVEGNEQAITAITFCEAPDELPSAHPLISKALDQLQEYFQQQRQQFDLPLAPKGTAFQQQVWQTLQRIPYGQTTSYGDIAQRLQNPKAVRAVGAANGKNPIAIVIPCHRIIGANGTLTGYAGGLDRKAWLLQRENPQQNFGAF